MKCVKIYTLIFHEQNNEVLIDMNSYMRMIACNEFINFYKILMFCKEMYIGRLHLAIIHLNGTLKSRVIGQKVCVTNPNKLENL